MMQAPTKRQRLAAPIGFEHDDDDVEDELVQDPGHVNRRRDPGYRLEVKRVKSALRHKSMLEEIFKKYGHENLDSDEVDLRTGKTVVNKGHLEALRDSDNLLQDDSEEYDESILTSKPHAAALIKAPTLGCLAPRARATISGQYPPLFPRGMGIGGQHIDPGRRAWNISGGTFGGIFPGGLFTGLSPGPGTQWGMGLPPSYGPEPTFGGSAPCRRIVTRKAIQGPIPEDVDEDDILSGPSCSNLPRKKIAKSACLGRAQPDNEKMGRDEAPNDDDGQILGRETAAAAGISPSNSRCRKSSKRPSDKPNSKTGRNEHHSPSHAPRSPKLKADENRRDLPAAESMRPSRKRKNRADSATAKVQPPKTEDKTGKRIKSEASQQIIVEILSKPQDFRKDFVHHTPASLDCVLGSEKPSVADLGPKKATPDIGASEPVKIGKISPALPCREEKGNQESLHLDPAEPSQQEASNTGSQSPILQRVMMDPSYEFSDEDEPLPRPPKLISLPVRAKENIESTSLNSHIGITYEEPTRPQAFDYTDEHMPQKQQKPANDIEVYKAHDSRNRPLSHAEATLHCSDLKTSAKPMRRASPRRKAAKLPPEQNASKPGSSGRATRNSSTERIIADKTSRRRRTRSNKLAPPSPSLTSHTDADMTAYTAEATRLVDKQSSSNDKMLLSPPIMNKSPEIQNVDMAELDLPLIEDAPVLSPNSPSLDKTKQIPDATPDHEHFSIPAKPQVAPKTPSHHLAPKTICSFVPGSDSSPQESGDEDELSGGPSHFFAALSSSRQMRPSTFYIPPGTNSPRPSKSRIFMGNLGFGGNGGSSSSAGRARRSRSNDRTEKRRMRHGDGSGSNSPVRPLSGAGRTRSTLQPRELVLRTPQKKGGNKDEWMGQSRSSSHSAPIWSRTPTPTLVKTPGGSRRRCGENGWICGRDWCFTCLQ